MSAVGRYVDAATAVKLSHAATSISREEVRVLYANSMSHGVVSDDREIEFKIRSGIVPNLACLSRSSTAADVAVGMFSWRAGEAFIATRR